MGNLTIKPASGGLLKLQDAGETDRVQITDGGSTVLYDEGGDAALTIETDGDVTIEDGDLVIGAAGHGIDFSGAQTAAGGTTNEVLSGYEEGTWAPSVVAVDVPTTMYHNSQSGRYTKIGNVVHLFFEAAFTPDSTEGEAGDYVINGVPFPSASIDANLHYTGALFSQRVGGSAAFNVLAIENSSSAIKLKQISTTEGLAGTIAVGETSGSSVYISGTITYRV